MKQILIFLCCLLAFDALSQCSEIDEYPTINKEYISSDGSGLYYANNGAYVGNNGAGVQIRALQSWDLSAIPDEAIILSVELSSQSDFEGTTNLDGPYEIVVRESSLEELGDASSPASAWNSLISGDELKTFSGPTSSINISFTGEELVSQIQESLDEDFFAISITAKVNYTGLWWSYANTNLTITWTTEYNEISENQVINAGATPNPLTGSNVSGTILWQQKTETGSYVNAVGLTANNLIDFSPDVLFETTKYRRLVGGDCPSNEVEITVSPSSEEIFGDQCILQGTTPSTINGTNRTGNIVWQQKTVNSSWEDIPGANSKDYSPGVINENTMFRRVINGVESNIVTISVYSPAVLCTEGEQYLLDNSDSWITTHGNPIPSFDNSLQSATLTLRSNNTTSIDGVCIHHVFQRGRTYKVSLAYKGDKNAHLQIFTAYKINYNPGGGTPSFRFRQWVEPVITNTCWETTELVFTANSFYDKLWIYQYVDAGMGQCDVQISRVAVLTEELTVEDYYIDGWETPRPYIAKKVTVGPGRVTVDDNGLYLRAEDEIIIKGLHVKPNAYLSATIENIYNDCVANNNVKVKSLFNKTSSELFELDTLPNIRAGETLKGSKIEVGSNEEDFKATITCEDIRIYPNPNDGVFIIQIPEDFDCKKLAIANSSGKIVYSDVFENQKTLEMDIKNMPPGIYFIKLISVDKVISRKIMKE